MNWYPSQSEIGVLEEFAVIMYDRSSSTNKVNDASLDLFAHKQHPYNARPAMLSFYLFQQMQTRYHNL
jgi:hypothetical protein